MSHLQVFSGNHPYHGWRGVRVGERCTFLLLAFVGVGLAQSPQDRAWEILQAGISDKNTDRRAIAVRVLGLIPNDARAVALAEKALEDEKPEVRVAAASGLGLMRARGSLSKLRKALEDKEVSVALAAAQSLIALRDSSGYGVYYAVLTGERKGGGGLLDEQLKTLREPKKMAQFGFEEGIGFVPFAGIGYGAIRALTKDDTSPLRAAAAKVLANDPDPRSDRALLQAAADKSWIVRVAALDAVAMRSNPALLPEIVSKMDDEKDAVRYTAAAAVVRLAALAKAKRPKTR